MGQFKGWTQKIESLPAKSDGEKAGWECSNTGCEKPDALVSRIDPEPDLFTNIEVLCRADWIWTIFICAPIACNNLPFLIFPIYAVGEMSPDFLSQKKRKNSPNSINWFPICTVSIFMWIFDLSQLEFLISFSEATLLSFPFILFHNHHLTFSYYLDR